MGCLYRARIGDLLRVSKVSLAFGRALGIAYIGSSGWCLFLPSLAVSPKGNLWCLSLPFMNCFALFTHRYWSMYHLNFVCHRPGRPSTDSSPQPHSYTPQYISPPLPLSQHPPTIEHDFPDCLEIMDCLKYSWYQEIRNYAMIFFKLLIRSEL